MGFKLNKPFKSLLIATAVASLAACGGNSGSGGGVTPPVISGSGSLKFGATALNIAVGSSATDTVILDTKDIGHNVSLSFSVQGSHAGDINPLVTPDASNCNFTTGNPQHSSCSITVDATASNTTPDNYMIITTAHLPDGSQQQSKQEIAVTVSGAITPVNPATIAEAVNQVTVPAGDIYVNGSFLNLVSNGDSGHTVTVTFAVSSAPDGVSTPIITTTSQNGSTGCSLTTGADSGMSSCSIKVDATHASISNRYILTPTVTMPDGHTTKQLPSIPLSVAQPVETFSVNHGNLGPLALDSSDSSEILTMAVNGASTGKTVTVTLPAVVDNDGTPVNGINVSNNGDNSSICVLSTTAGAIQTCSLKVAVGGAVTTGTYTFTPTVTMPDGSTQKLTGSTITIGVNGVSPPVFKEVSNAAAINAGAITQNPVKIFELDGNGVDRGGIYKATFSQPTGGWFTPVIIANSNVMDNHDGSFTCTLISDGSNNNQYCKVTADATFSTPDIYTIFAPTYTDSLNDSGWFDTIVITVKMAPTVTFNTSGSVRMMAWEQQTATLSLTTTHDVGTLVYDLSVLNSVPTGVADPVTITNNADGSSKCSLSLTSPICTINIAASHAGTTVVVANPESTAPAVTNNVPVTVNDLLAGNSYSQVLTHNSILTGPGTGGQTLDGDHVDSTFVDFDGHLWAGTSKLYINDSPFAAGGGLFVRYTGYTPDDGNICTITEDNSGNMYIGTCMGDNIGSNYTVYKLSKESTTWQVAGNDLHSLDASGVNQTLVDNNGNVYALTAYNNLWELIGGHGTWTKLITAGQPLTPYCTVCSAVSMATDGTKLYIGSGNDITNSHYVVVYDGTSWSDTDYGMSPPAMPLQTAVDNADDIYVVAHYPQDSTDVYYLPSNGIKQVWIGMATDQTGEIPQLGRFYAVVDPISKHLYMTTQGSPLEGYGNIYDCNGAVARCKIVPRFGGNNVPIGVQSSIYSLSITHY